jgi:glycosyltransferase involved in cell wall biosynthesis
MDEIRMNSRGSLLIMLHCEQFTGYAIGVLENIFYEAAKRSGYKDEEIFWSYKSITDNGAGNIIACDYRRFDASHLLNFLQAKNIAQVIAFDLNYPAKILDVLKQAKVNRIISYWGAGISSVNSGIKLALKRVEWLLRRNKPDCFIFESEAMRETGTSGRGIPYGKTFVLPLGVDTEKYKPDYGKNYYAHDLLGISRERKIIFYSGHMEERKGVRVIVQAAIELVDKIKNTGVHFVLCGNKGNESLVYETLLENTEAVGYVTFAGYRNDIADLMRSSSVGVIASTGWDSFTMSSVEMMASGLPLIVSNLQGLAETTVNGVTGFHIEPGDYQALAERINYLCSSPQQAMEFSAAARLRAVELFSKEQQINGLAEILCGSR